MFESLIGSPVDSDESDRDSQSSSSTISHSKLKVGTEVALLLLMIKSQIKIFHWQTTQLGHHYALDSLFNSLNKINDRWVETFQGKYGRIALGSHMNDFKNPGFNFNFPNAILIKGRLNCFSYT